MDDDFAARVGAVLMGRGLGRDALSVIGNVLRHEAPLPRAAPILVRELLARPLAAVDAGGSFNRAVPAALRRLAEAAARGDARAGVRNTLALDITKLLAGYLADLEQAQRLLGSAVAEATIDGKSVAARLDEEGLSAGMLQRLAMEVDPVVLNHATNAFLDATARFVNVLIERSASVRFPAEAIQFDSPIGKVSIGTRGDDRHGPDAALIIDPDGNDSYERRPATDGAISIIIDLGGNDRYSGVDVVVNGFSAIVDFSGIDRYTMNGPGLGAAVLGASVLVDLAGDDVYEAGRFAQGAAAFGVGAIIDLAGNDRYRVHAWGQGFAMAHGVALLWDHAGDDTYVAGGVRDAYERGGGISMAQGAAQGLRTSLGGGIGILRDDAGNDTYEAEMFAQGVGYYHGLGLLWDRAGNDRYRAVRYAQGNGVHEAAGILRDDGGDDSYELTFGVGQGMGLDLAVGVLFDAAGANRYQSQVLAQGAATANGVGIVIDAGSGTEWVMGADRRSWGHTGWARGLPSLGLILYEPTLARFMRDGKEVEKPAGNARSGDASRDEAAAPEPSEKPRCAEIAPGADDRMLTFAEAMRRIETGFLGGDTDRAAYAAVRHRLTTRLQESIAELPHDDFNVVWSFSRALYCAFVGATREEAESMWRELEAVLVREPATPLAGPIADVLRLHFPPAEQAQRMLRVLDDHPSCSVRATALRLRQAALSGEASRTATIEAAQAALGSSCWRLQAAARDVLKKMKKMGSE